MIHSYVTSRLDNGNCLLYGISDHLLTKLQRVQNAAARLITKTKKHDHITAVLIDLHWLPIKQRIEYKLLLLTFRSLHGLAASYITDLLIRYEPTRALRSADAHLLEVPRCRLRTQGEKAFSSRGWCYFANFIFLMEYPLKTCTCYARVQKYNLLTGCLILTPL